MKKIIAFCMLCLMTSGLLFGQEPEQPKNVIGISYGLVPTAGDMFFGSPWNFWPYRYQSPVYQLFYDRQVRRAIKIGGYFEYERVKFTAAPTYDVHSFKRFNLGVSALGQFPKTPLHMEAGGYLGLGLLNAQNWNNLSGIDFGLIAGPAFEKGPYGVAFHVQYGHANYNSSGTPGQVRLYNPKFMLKVYYRF